MSKPAATQRRDDITAPRAAGHREMWERLAGEVNGANPEVRLCFNSAEENASATGGERGFAEHSPEWYAVFYRSYVELWESGMYAHLND